MTHIVGPYSGMNPDAESQLDIEYASTLGLNSTYWFWTVQGWMMEFSNDLFSKPGPLVVSMSWGWPEDAQCQIAVQCTGITSHQYVSRVDTEWLKITSTGKNEETKANAFSDRSRRVAAQVCRCLRRAAIRARRATTTRRIATACRTSIRALVRG